MSKQMIAFIKESNEIERIYRDPSIREIEEFKRFFALDKIHMSDIERFVSVYQSNARMRVSTSDNVQIGTYLPPRGGQHILYQLDAILHRANSNRTEEGAYNTHNEYESLHPFTDGNGRSGRMLWVWQMKDNNPFSYSFLQRYYYQSLAYCKQEGGSDGHTRAG